MNKEKFFSDELVFENDLLVLRLLKRSDIDAIETICFSPELGEFGARVKDKNDLLGYLAIVSLLNQTTNYILLLY